MEGLLYTPNTSTCMLDVRGFGGLGGGAVEGDLSLRGFVYGWGFRASGVLGGLPLEDRMLGFIRV